MSAIAFFLQPSARTIHLPSMNSRFRPFRRSRIPTSTAAPPVVPSNAGFEFDKEIIPHLAVGISDDFIWQNPSTGKATHGWDNLGLSIKDELYWNDEHEFILSFGMDTDVGGTGSRSVHDSTTTFTPTVYFGKGFGDLPNSLNALKPFAITGTLGQSVPTSGDDPHQFQYGVALEYSFPYLQEHVTDIGLPAPLKDTILVCEFPFESDEDRGTAGQTSGTVNPGFMWELQYAQIGAEAIIPVNGRSGGRVGFVLQAWIFIDDLFPNHFGHPLFGGDR